jgi:hypothetical protein
MRRRSAYDWFLIALVALSAVLCGASVVVMSGMTNLMNR